jgi:RNA-directed DNA polymerase
MSGQTITTKHPVGREVHAKVRRLQVKLWRCAKRSKERRFHALYDRIFSGPVLQEAWARVRRNGGACGIDGQTLKDVEAGGVENLLTGIEEDLKGGTYRPMPVRRVMIPKKSGKGERPLGIPVVRDRVVQMAASLVLTPIFEADFQPCSFGYRPKRSTVDALERIRVLANRGYNHVVDADIKSYFTRIDHDLLEELVARRVSDRRVQKLIRQWMKSGVMEDGVCCKTEVGTPQGGVISPLLSNVMLNELDKAWETTNRTWGKLTRYCDDFVIQCVSRKQAEVVLKKAQAILKGLKLEMHPEKTRIVDLSWGKEKMTFLGHTLKKVASYRFAGKMYLNRWPNQASMNAVRARIRGIIHRGRCGVKNVREFVPELNRVLQGWGNHFRSGNAGEAFTKIDGYVHRRLALFENRRRGRDHPHWFREFTHEWYRSLGIYNLIGTVRYPNPSLVLVKANA